MYKNDAVRRLREAFSLFTALCMSQDINIESAVIKGNCGKGKNFIITAVNGESPLVEELERIFEQLQSERG